MNKLLCTLSLSALMLLSGCISDEEKSRIEHQLEGEWTGEYENMVSRSVEKLTLSFDIEDMTFELVSNKYQTEDGDTILISRETMPGHWDIGARNVSLEMKSSDITSEQFNKDKQNMFNAIANIQTQDLKDDDTSTTLKINNAQIKDNSMKITVGDHNIDFTKVR